MNPETDVQPCTHRIVPSNARELSITCGRCGHRRPADQTASGLVPEEGPESVLPPLARGGLVNVGPGGNLDLNNLFTYHPPHGDQVERFALIRDAGFQLATIVAQNTPGSVERSTALAKIREAVMWANAAIACNEPGPS